ncbi:MAG: type III-B CRISPR module-associated Cmr3 family protein [Candidatus Woesearchaeota archaeon]
MITLKPLDTFFFGQENKYRKKITDKGYSTEDEYFQKSSYFPQQTTILGMLRYYILLINGQIPITDKHKAIDLIGYKSFHLTTNDIGYGKIKSISPVFISDLNNSQYYPNPKDYLNGKDNFCLLRGKMFDNMLKTNMPSNKFFYFESYNEKDGLDNFLLSFDGKSKLNYDEVFKDVEKIGITKSINAEEKEDAFYKQIAYKLNERFSFAFYAEIDDSYERLPEIYTVPMGAEKSAFIISSKPIVEETDFADRIYITNHNSPKIVLLSDSFITDDIFKLCAFSISDTVPFRFLETEVRVNNNNYYYSNPLKKKEGEISRSIRLNLIQRGSVFFFDDINHLEQFEKSLKKEINFRKIGYNHYKVVKE